MGFDIKHTLQSSLQSSILILKLVIPLYIFADILIYFGRLDYISFIFEPVTTILHLPAQTALALYVGIFLNIYAAIAFAAPLGLSPYEWTILGMFLGIYHSMLIESAIMKKLGISFRYAFSPRLFMPFSLAIYCSRFFVEMIVNDDEVFLNL